MISLQNASKTYGGLRALDAVSFEMQPGEIMAIVGKNGSGKSTLIKILSGVIKADQGEMRLRGKRVSFSSPSEALRHGIVTVHQELSVIPSLTVAENIVLGHWPLKEGPVPRIDYPRMEQIARDILAELNEEKIDARALVSSLSVAEKQIVEIARALVQRPDVLLLDEPFSTLSAQEVAVMSQRIEAIAKAGLCVAFVTHRLGEVKDIATSVMVLRDGQLMAKSASADVTVEQVAQLMLGEAITKRPHYKSRKTGTEVTPEPVLSLRNFAIPGKFEGLDLDLRSGEIAGIAGLLGSGRSELLRALVGLHPCSYDRFTLMGQDIASPDLQTMIDAGVYFVPEERKLEGIVGQMSVLENFSLPVFASSPLLRRIGWPAVQESSQQMATRMSVKTSNLSESILNLSGGNQQKVVLGKWMNRGGAKLFLLDEPSRGVDIQARMQIEKVVEDLADQGVAVLMVASEFEELFDLCDRLILVGHGRRPRLLDVGETSIEAVTAELLGA